MKRLALGATVLAIAFHISASRTETPVVDPRGAAVEVARPEPLTGIATWYDATRDGSSAWYTRKGIRFYAAAGPELRKKLGGYRWREVHQIRITNPATGQYAVALVVDWCQCSKGQKDERLVDLSPALFVALGTDLGRGKQTVEIEIMRGAR